MKLHIYSVFDSVANTYGTPFFAISDALAARSFGNLTLDPQSTVSLNPADFALYKIGCFYDDNANGEFIQPPMLICRALEFIRSTS